MHYKIGKGRVCRYTAAISHANNMQHILKIRKERVCRYTWNKTCKQHALQNMQGTSSPLYMQ